MAQHRAAKALPLSNEEIRRQLGWVLINQRANQENTEWVADSDEKGNWFVMTNAAPSTGRLIDVAAVCKGNDFGEREARLMSASREMLAALIAHEEIGNSMAVRKQIRAAIAKATDK